MIPYGKQNIDSEDIDAVVRVLKSEYLTQGPCVSDFEDAISEKCGAKYTVASNSATSSLHLSCLALGVGTGDLVWTTAITFVASANCAVYCGAEIDFVDIDSKTFNIDIDALKVKLKFAKNEGRLPKVVIPVHLGGRPCEMEEISALSREYGFKIIEDASHAIGATYQNNPTGSCIYSDITVFSFHPVKIITTGEGGAACTNDSELANRMRRLRSHGITRAADEFEYVSDGPWYYEQNELGYNYRMSDIEAALGMSQLRKLDLFISERRAIASRYVEMFKDSPIIVQQQSANVESSYHLFIIRTNLRSLRASQTQIFERLSANGINANLHYIPLYRHPYFSKLGFNPSEFPEAESYYSNALSIPIFPGLTIEQQELVVECIQKPLGHQVLF